MMKYFFKSSKKYITIALAAAMVTAFAAESADSALYGPLRTTASDTEALTEVASEGSIGGEVLDDVFGETTFYRWEEVNSSNFPQDSDEHLSLFFFGNNNEYASMALAPDCIYMGPSADPVDGVKNKIKDTGKYGDFSGNGSIQEQNCYYIKCEDRGLGTDRAQVHPEKPSFFTTDDMHGFMTKYIGMNGSSPKYKVFLQSDNGLKYYLEGDESSREGMLDIETHDKIRDWTFKKRDHSKRGGTCWEIYHDDGSLADDEELVFKSGFITVADWDHDDKHDVRWFIGKKMKFSTIKGDVTVHKDQVLVIGNDQYVSTEGETEESNGCIIPNGETITIEKGGILSVSGELINNGSIINNGGVILIKDGGCISPFIQGENVAVNGCGTIKCLDGDILIMEGGALYAGLLDTKCEGVPFCLDGSSNLINMGVLAYGSCRLGDYANVELYETSHTYGSFLNGKIVESQSAYMLPFRRPAEQKNVLRFWDCKWGWLTKEDMQQCWEASYEDCSNLSLATPTLLEYWDCEIKTNNSNINGSGGAASNINGSGWAAPALSSVGRNIFGSEDKFGKYVNVMNMFGKNSIPSSDLLSGSTKYLIANTPEKLIDLSQSTAAVRMYDNMFQCMYENNYDGRPFYKQDINHLVETYPPKSDEFGYFHSALVEGVSPRDYLEPYDHVVVQKDKDFDKIGKTGMFVQLKNEKKFGGHVRVSKDTRLYLDGSVPFDSGASGSVFYDTTFGVGITEDLIL